MAACAGLGDFNFYLPYVRENLDRLSAWELTQLRKNQLAALRRWLLGTVDEAGHVEMLRLVVALITKVDEALHIRQLEPSR